MEMKVRASETWRSRLGEGVEGRISVRMNGHARMNMINAKTRCLDRPESWRGNKPRRPDAREGLWTSGVSEIDSDGLMFEVRVEDITVREV